MFDEMWNPDRHSVALMENFLSEAFYHRLSASFCLTGTNKHVKENNQTGDGMKQVVGMETWIWGIRTSTASSFPLFWLSCDSDLCSVTLAELQNVRNWPGEKYRPLLMLSIKLLWEELVLRHICTSVSQTNGKYYWDKSWATFSEQQTHPEKHDTHKSPLWLTGFIWLVRLLAQLV